MTLYEAQNEPHLLRCLVARRRMNSRCKTFSCACAVLSLLGVVLGWMADGYGDSNCKLGWFAVVAAISWLMIKLLGCISTATKRKAALLQQYFDARIFAVEASSMGNTALGVSLTDSEIVELINNVSMDDVRDAKVENWYQPTEGLNSFERILDCQCQCVRWEKTQRWCYFVFSSCMVFVICIGGLVMNMDAKLYLFTYRLLLAGAFVEMLVDGAVCQISDLIRIHGIMDLIRRIEHGDAGLSVDFDSLVYLQNRIYEHRREASYIPDWFYWLCHKWLQPRAERISEVRKEMKGEAHA